MSDVVPARLVELEQVIERGLATFVEVGQALIEIRDGRLYRETHGTFEAYCGQRWNLSRKRAYDMTAAAEVAQLVSPMGDTPAPLTERVARELGPLRAEPVALREAWGETIERHGPAPTAAQTAEVVRERLPGPKTAFAQAAATGEAVLDSTGHWQTGRDPADEGGIHFLAFQRWAEDIPKMPPPARIVVPPYGRDAYEHAAQVRAFIDQFLAARQETAA